MSSYSQAVLAGLELKGIPFKRSQIAGISKIKLSGVTKGKREFTDRELLAIEKVAGFTAGQLAAFATEPTGGHLTDMANRWAKFHQLVEAHSQRSRPKRRPTKPRRKLAHAR
jgi:hypothetical protein